MCPQHALGATRPGRCHLSDIEEATSQLLGPVMFHRYVFADGTIDPDFAAHMIDPFIASRTGHAATST